MTEQDKWSEVDSYFDALFAPQDAALTAAHQATVDADIPLMAVSPSQGKMLYVLARGHGAKSVLEIGTLAGYSTIWLARAVPADGKVITLEVSEKHAAVAQANIDRAGVADKVSIRLAKAIETLPKLVEEKAGLFDLVFIDADKASTPDYLTWTLKLTHPGSLIIIDNVVRRGDVTDTSGADPNVQGTRRALEMIAKEPKLLSFAVQTVGSKGYDGFAMAYVVH
jgi:predicted O-methyltransferase YrrM